MIGTNQIIFMRSKLLLYFNPFMHNVEKWPNILKTSCGLDTSRFSKYGHFLTLCIKGIKKYTVKVGKKGE